MIVGRYEAARAQAGDAAIEKLRSGRQLLAIVQALVALRAKARSS